MTAAAIGALTAAGAKAGKSASGVLKTPLAHVGVHIGPLDVEGNVTPWGIIAAVIGADVAMTLYKGHKEQFKLQGDYYRAKAYGLLYASLCRIDEANIQRFVTIAAQYPLEKDPRKRLEMERSMITLKDTIVSTEKRIRQMEIYMKEKFPDLWLVLGTVYQGGSAAQQIIRRMAELPKPKYEAPSPMKALGSALGSLVTDVTSGIKSGWGR